MSILTVSPLYYATQCRALNCPRISRHKRTLFCARHNPPSNDWTGYTDLERSARMVSETEIERGRLFVDHLADTKMDLLVNRFQALTLRERMAEIKDEEDDSSSYHTAPESISAGDEVDTQGKVDWDGGSRSYHTASEYLAEDEEE